MENRKVCKHGLNDIWVNGADGNVRMCGWSNYFIGNLAEKSIEEIWNSEEAEEFRKSMLDGSYRYCNHAKCPYCANHNLEEEFVDYEVPQYPTMCSLSYQLQCNYVCKFCRTEHYTAGNNENEKYVKIEKEIEKLVPTLQTISANGAGELFCSDSILRFLGKVNTTSKIKVILETNGSLMNPKNWEKIANLGNYDLSVSVTVHSFNEDTYQFLSGTKLPVKNIIDNLHFISSLREAGIVNKFTIATVICERNFREMPDFVKKCLDEFAVDKIRLRFFEPYGAMDRVTEWFYDVRNPHHPYYEEFQRVMQNPIFKDEKVWKWQGEEPSLQEENPYVLEHRNSVNISELLLLDGRREKIDCYVRNGGKMALYGGGIVGRAYAKILKENGLEFETIFDTFAKEELCPNLGCRIVRPTLKNVKEYEWILVAQNTYLAEIQEELSRLNYQGKIISMDCFVNELRQCKG